MDTYQKYPALLTRAFRKVKRTFFPKKNPYTSTRKMLEAKDRQNGLKRPELQPLHDELNKLNIQQKKKWNSFVYCDGYYYQGYEKIGISGIKPTEKRIENYQIEDFFDSQKTVLDIGSNAGFFACHLAEFYKSVEGIELNPYLIKMGEITSQFLNKKNVQFTEGNFIEYDFKNKYDVVFSLSNHYTIDGNLNITFESFIQKIHGLLNDEGILFFESHSINGEDKDMNQKIAIAAKYFELVKYKMVKAFYPHDIDKLFIIFKKTDQTDSPVIPDFNLDTAKNKYVY